MTDITHENSLATFDHDILTELLRDKRSPRLNSPNIKTRSRPYPNPIIDYYP
jgi:hypothetical protein